MIRVTFGRPDGVVGPVLVSNEKRAIFNVSCPGCEPAELATAVDLPLNSVVDMCLSVCPTSETAADDSERWGYKPTTLISLNATHGGKKGTVNLGYPRAQLVIEADEERPVPKH